MNALVTYGSSDEEDDIQPEKPAKIAKTGASEPALTTAFIDGLQSRQELAFYVTDRFEAPPVPLSQEEHDAKAIHSRRPLEEDTPVDAETGYSRSEQVASTAPTEFPTVMGPNRSQDASSDAYAYERQRVRELTMPAVPNFDIPDSPPPPPMNSEEAAVLAASTKKFERFLELKKQGIHFNKRLQDSKAFRNPSLLSNLMDAAGISLEESYESALPEDLAVATKWPEECYVENLVRENERRQKKRLADRDKIEFVSTSRPAEPGLGGQSGGNGKEDRNRAVKK